MKTSTILLLVLAYVVYTNMGSSSAANSPKPAPQQPQNGGGNTFNDVLSVIRQTVKNVDDYLANDRNAPAGASNPS